MKNGMKSTREFMEAVARMEYRAMFPWERFWYNRARRKRGLPALTMREIRRS